MSLLYFGHFILLELWITREEGSIYFVSNIRENGKLLLRVGDNIEKTLSVT